MPSPDPSYPRPDEQYDLDRNDARQWFADVLHHVDQRELERAAQLIKEDMEYMGPVRVTDVEAAQV